MMVVPSALLAQPQGSSSKPSPISQALVSNAKILTTAAKPMLRIMQRGVALERALKDVHSSDIETAREALLYLAGMERPNTLKGREIKWGEHRQKLLPTVEKLVFDTDSRTRVAAVVVLSKLGSISERGLTKAVSHLSENYIYVKALSRFGDRATKALLPLLDSADEKFLRFALDVIAQSGSRGGENERALQAFVKERKAIDRSLIALRRVGTKRSIGLLTGLIQSKDNEFRTRVLAAVALRDLDSRQNTNYQAFLREAIKTLALKIPNSPTYWGEPLWLAEQLGSDALPTHEVILAKLFDDTLSPAKKNPYQGALSKICGIEPHKLTQILRSSTLSKQQKSAAVKSECRR